VRARPSPAAPETSRQPPAGHATTRKGPEQGLDWTGFDTEAHRSAPAGCRHLIHCAVDGATRERVVADLGYARSVGDLPAIQLLIAQLTGPCCLPAASDQ
jgi:hypothetical protein